MHAADLVVAVEVGQRARDAQHAMVTAGGKPHGVGGFAPSASPLPSGFATSSSTVPDTAALLRTCGSPIAT
jgi:hypothetical protein